LRGELEETYGVEITGYWTLAEMGILRDSFTDLESGMGESGITMMGGVTIHRQKEIPKLEAEYDKITRTIYLSDVVFSDTKETAQWTIIHEMGHRYDHTLNFPSDDIWTAIADKEPCDISFCSSPMPISPYDKRAASKTETFAQAFALTYFTGDTDRVKGDLRPWNDTPEQREQLHRAREYIFSLQVTD
jgi:hypothetical protein